MNNPYTTNGRANVDTPQGVGPDAVRLDPASLKRDSKSGQYSEKRKARKDAKKKAKEEEY